MHMNLVEVDAKLELWEQASKNAQELLPTKHRLMQQNLPIAACGEEGFVRTVKCVRYRDNDSNYSLGEFSMSDKKLEVFEEDDR